MPERDVDPLDVNIYDPSEAAAEIRRLQTDYSILSGDYEIVADHAKATERDLRAANDKLATLEPLAGGWRLQREHMAVCLLNPELVSEHDLEIARGIVKELQDA